MTWTSLLAFVSLAFTQDTAIIQSRLVLDQVHGESLQDTITGENPDRTVAVYLPPSYDSSPERRYPVVYLLHGIGGTHRDWTIPWSTSGSKWNTIQDIMDREIAAGRLTEFLVVSPNQMTNGGGSFYTNSTVTGDWEDFTVSELVAHVDTKYRTRADAKSRGIAGHSMGGFGAIRLGMKHPDVYSAVYGMSAAILGWAADLSAENHEFRRAAAATPATLNPRNDFWPASLICVAQALSPDPDRPPFFVGLPFADESGQLAPAEPAHSQWEGQMPLYMPDEVVLNLRTLRGLQFDVGRSDEFKHIAPTNRLFSERLDALGIPHVHEEYNGDHRNRLWGQHGRLATRVLPFFARTLVFEEE